MNEIGRQNLSFLKENDFFIGKDMKTGLDCFLIPNSLDFLRRHPEVGASILQQCQNVQDSVWAKRNSTLANTFEVGNLLLITDKSSVMGFVSFSFFHCSKETVALYISDAMFLSVIQKKGLCSLLFSLCHNFFEKKYGKEFSNFISILVSGNFATFKFFERMDCFVELNTPLEKIDEHNAIMQYVSARYPNTKVTFGGIISNAWLPQRIPNSLAWPAQEARQIGLPSFVNYQAGDALFRCYHFKIRNIDAINKSIRSRLQTMME